MDDKFSVQNEFHGELKSLAPDRMTRKDQEAILDAFLALAVIYNDLDGVAVFNHCLSKHYRQPNQGEVSFHSGKFGGLTIHVQKLYAATIRGFMEFLQENGEIISSAQFQQIVEHMPSSERETWRDMVKVANGIQAPISPLLKVLEKIRHTVTAHYKQAGELLRKGYIQHFLENPKNPANEKAYYAFGQSHSESRIFYADAAVEAYLQKIAIDGVKLPMEEYRKNLSEVVRMVSGVLFELQKAYVKSVKYP